MVGRNLDLREKATYRAPAVQDVYLLVLLALVLTESAMQLNPRNV